MNINHAAKDFINKNLFLRESGSDYLDKDTISAMDLFLASKNRSQLAQDYLASTVVSEIPEIENAWFSCSYMDENEIAIEVQMREFDALTAKNPLTITLASKGDQLCILGRRFLELELETARFYQKSPVHVQGQMDYLKYMLLNKYRDLFSEVTQFGVENHFHQVSEFSTVSKNFICCVNASSFSLSLSSEILESYHKYLEFICDYVHKMPYKHTIPTDLAIFSLQTNLRGMKEFISQPGEFRNGEKNKIIRLLNHLQIDESLLPDYLLEEVEKVKVLRH